MPSPSRSPSSPRSAQAQVEQLYNTAVQTFVRRDHARSLSTLGRLVELLSAHPRPKGEWWDLSSPQKGTEAEGWREKVLKLYISAVVSFYSDPKSTIPSTTPSSSDHISSELLGLLPPSPPNKLLELLQRTCESHALPTHPDPSTEPIPALLSPSLLSTLLLASLKLQPATPALDFAHHLAEDWLARVPDGFLDLISRHGASIAANGPSSAPAPPHGGRAEGPEMKKRVEGLREGYLKVTELFVGEVLVREGEWEMARAFLEGEGVMGSKRKENLYRHIRSAESRQPASPSNSLILPSPSSSGILPPTPSSRRSRTSSASSSSSEATARPTPTPTHLAAPRRSARGRERLLDRKSGGPRAGRKAEEVEADDEKEAAASESTRSSLPSKLYINHSPASSSRFPLRPAAPRSTLSGSSSSSRGWESLLVLLPKSVQVRVRPIVSNPWLLAAVSLPIPIIFLITLAVGIRRKILRKRNEVAGRVVGRAAEAVAAVGGSTVAIDAMADVRARLRRTREKGMRAWVAAWVRWWIGKVVGVWKMGTTITYL